MKENIEFYSVYVLECSDGTFYTGITKDVNRRILEHKSKAKGAKYFRGRKPTKLVFEHLIGSRGLALKVEIKIKKLTHLEKMNHSKLQSIVNECVDHLISEKID